MIVRPRINEIVRIWYRASKRSVAPHHGEIAVVKAVGKGPGPRNHLVELEDYTQVVVPCGNIRRPA